MPNWVSNGLTIKGTKSELTEFAKILEYTDTEENRTTELSFDTTVPLPESMKEDWYNWQIANWGTKWNACEVSGGEVYEHKYANGKTCFVLAYGFDTAWSCPTEWVVTTSEQYPSLIFNNVWTEEQGFKGVVRAKGGEVSLLEHLDTPQIEDFYIYAKEHGIEIPEGFEEENWYEYDEFNEWYSEQSYNYPSHWEDI